MATKELRTRVDWNPIDAYIECLNLPKWDKDNLREMIAAVCLKFLDQDVELGVYDIEKRFVLPGTIPKIGTTDLRLGPLGQKIADWKTAGSLSAEWVARMKASWQWRIYLWATGADEFSYRGIQRDGYVREVQCLRYPELNFSVENYLNGVENEIRALDEFAVWPMKRPFACRAYGRPCPRITDCLEQDGTDRAIVRVEYLDYTNLELFGLCPERFRRWWRDGGRESDAESTDDTNFGGAFHTAISMVYEQFVGGQNISDKSLDKSPAV